jgi:hypothetical protein
MKPFAKRTSTDIAFGAKAYMPPISATTIAVEFLYFNLFTMLSKVEFGHLFQLLLIIIYCSDVSLTITAIDAAGSY